jgi:hypothetical protein
MRSTVVRGGLLAVVVAAAAVGGIPASAATAATTPGARVSAPVAAHASSAAVKAACTSCGHNLIANPSAEAGKGGGGEKVPVPGWTQHGQFTAASYAWPGGDVDGTSAGPKNRGANYFYGGPSNTRSWATQTVKVAKSGVKTGKVRYTLSGWFGGYETQADQAVLTASFRNAKGKQLATAKIGRVSSADRDGVSKLLRRKTKGKVPAKTRQVVVTLVMTRAEGDWNDGIADSLSLVLKVKR